LNRVNVKQKTRGRKTKESPQGKTGFPGRFMSELSALKKENKEKRSTHPGRTFPSVVGR
jgi:hypothetical protein